MTALHPQTSTPTRSAIPALKNPFWDSGVIVVTDYKKFIELVQSTEKKEGAQIIDGKIIGRFSVEHTIIPAEVSFKFLKEEIPHLLSSQTENPVFLKNLQKKLIVTCVAEGHQDAASAPLFQIELSLTLRSSLAQRVTLIFNKIY